MVESSSKKTSSTDIKGPNAKYPSESCPISHIKKIIKINNKIIIIKYTIKQNSMSYSRSQRAHFMSQPCAKEALSCISMVACLSKILSKMAKGFGVKLQKKELTFGGSLGPSRVGVAWILPHSQEWGMTTPSFNSGPPS